MCRGLPLKKQKSSRQQGSQRRNSALQIHHLSLHLILSVKSISTTVEEGKVEKEGKEIVVERERDYPLLPISRAGCAAYPASSSVALQG